jgi:cation-transporting ATPase 13A1
MDDYWYYSMFTLMMLLFFEGMLCKQRQNNLLMLRNMRRPPQQVVALRCGQWCQLSSDELVPGDVIILSSSLSYGNDQSQQHSQQQSTESVVPCDGVILSGSCVVNEAMLTGESVPQVKEALINDASVGPTLDIGTEFNSETGALWKSHVVLGGTVMLQHASSGAERLPVSGCKVLVLRTGFGTTQGMLMRKILFATNRNTKQSLETFYFIGILVIFAVMASATVLYNGYYDENRNKFKLFLHCIMIITSVIPPELPMELSLAVTTSLAALGKCLVYCTEPDRIELAGKVTVMCFDKTGTLTKDRMMLDGLLCNQDKPLLLSSSSLSESVAVGTDTADDTGAMMRVDDIKNSASLAARVIMASCHSLAMQGNKGMNLVGDPLEVAAFNASGLFFESVGSQLTMPSFVSTRSNIRVQTLHRYPFSSSLKRMSVLVEISRSAPDGQVMSPQRQWLVVTKGAPEVISSRLRRCPANYHDISAQYMARGKRVLAIACKLVSEVEAKGSASSSSGSRSTTNANYVYARDQAERDLEFSGFLVFDCELKSDSKSVIRELVQSSHRVMMITGDNPLTAIDVADRLDFMKKNAATLIYNSKSNRIQPAFEFVVSGVLLCGLCRCKHWICAAAPLEASKRLWLTGCYVHIGRSGEA